MNNKNYKLPLLTVISCLLIVILAVGINFASSKLPNSALKLDTTANGLNTLSDESKEYISSIDEDIDVYFICEEGNENVITQNLLANIAELNDKISIENVDPAINPNFMKDYTQEKTVSNNSIIVSSDKRFKYIDSKEYDTSTYYMGEDYLVSAFSYVTADKLPVIYNITGHDEQQIPEQLISNINLDGYSVEDINLSESAAIPSDAKMLTLIAPKSDLNDDEITLVLDYLQDGGRLVLITAAQTSSMENILSIADNYGTQMVEGYIYEDESGNHVKDLPTCIIPEINSNVETSDILSGIDYTILPLAHGIVEKDNYRDSIKVYGFLKTSDYAYAKKNNGSADQAGRANGDAEGPFMVGAAISESFGDSVTKIVWVSSVAFLDGEINDATSGENYALFMNSIDWLDDDNVSTLHSKLVSKQSLKLKASEIKLGGVVVLGIIPLASLLIGILIWLRRKAR